MSRVIQWFADIVREPVTEPAPHFHQGPGHAPVVCFDDRCGSPRLEVRTG